MATITQGKADPEVQSLKDALEAYELAHPGADAAIYRQNVASIRLRVVDRRFEGMSKTRRHAHLWEFLAARVAEDTLADVSLVLTIAPSELRDSFANFEFQRPISLRALKSYFGRASVLLFRSAGGKRSL